MTAGLSNDIRNFQNAVTGGNNRDGSHRRLYCLESPESWFEDLGKGQLQGGQANVHGELQILEHFLGFSEVVIRSAGGSSRRASFSNSSPHRSKRRRPESTRRYPAEQATIPQQTIPQQLTWTGQ
jgi:hypothetical protein